MSKSTPLCPNQALLDIELERARQQLVEGWTPEHDDTYNRFGELADAAACYASHYDNSVGPDGSRPSLLPLWPWAAKWWKPKTRRRDLVKAGALIVAEIERLDREAAKQAGETPVANEKAFTDLECGPDDDGGWNLEGSGLCSVDRFARALSVWLHLQEGQCRLNDAVKAFNADPNVILRAISEQRQPLGLESGDVLVFTSNPLMGLDGLEDRHIWDAIQIIACAHPAPDDPTGSPVDVVARILNLPATKICQVVSDGAPWLYLHGDNICHEGE